MSPARVPVKVEDHYTSLVLASGFDGNGSTEIMVYLNFDYPPDQRVFVSNSDTCDTPAVTPLNSVTMGISAKNVSNTTPRSLLLPEYDPQSKQLCPLSAAVFHGAIVLAGPVLVPDTADPTPDRWTYGGWAFAINRDSGDPTKWHLLWEDPTVAQPNYNRGQAWCLKACPANNRVPHPTEMWVCCTDYRSQPSSGSVRPDGGRVYVARMSRTTTTSTDWAISGGETADFRTFDLSQGTPDATLLPVAGCHAHAAYVCEYGRTDETTYKDVQLVLSLGDSQQNNRIARLIWDDNASVNHDFMNGWTVADDFHGTKSSADNRGTWSFQPVGVASGPMETRQVTIGEQTFECFKPSLVWGGDVEAEWLVKMTPPVYGITPDQLTCQHLWGWSTGFGALRSGYLNWPYFLTGTVTEQKPEGFGPLVAVAYDTSTSTTPAPESLPPPDDLAPAPDAEYLHSRILFNPGFGQSGTGESQTGWHQVMAVRSKTNSQVASAVYYCGSIYYTIASEVGKEADGPGLYRIAAPSDTTDFQPIIVSPGGENLVHPSYNVAGDTGDQPTAVTALSLQTPGTHNGVFVDDTVTLPACPTMAERAYKIQTTRAPSGTSNPFITRVHVSSSSATTWNDLGVKFPAGPMIFRARAWVMDNSYNNGVFAPNKTLQMSSQFINLAPDDTTPSYPSQAATTTYSCSDRWCPVTMIGFQEFKKPGPNDPANALGIFLRSSWSGGGDPDDNNFYFVMDSALSGFGSLPYPIVPTTGTVTAAPPELLTLTSGTGGPVLDVGGSNEWSVKVAALLPEGDWDQYAQRIPDPPSPSDDLRFWPLFTLWANDSNYIEFRADCVKKQFEAKSVVGGTVRWKRFSSPELIWLPNSQLFAVISCKRYQSGLSSQQRFYFGASLGGGPAVFGGATGFPAWPAGAPGFTQLRFRGGPIATPGPAERSDEVVTMRWVGGEFVTGSGSACTDLTSLQAALADPSLAWMKGP